MKNLTIDNYISQSLIVLSSISHFIEIASELIFHFSKIFAVHLLIIDSDKICEGCKIKYTPSLKFIELFKINHERWKCKNEYSYMRHRIQNLLIEYWFTDTKNDNNLVFIKMLQDEGQIELSLAILQYDNFEKNIQKYSNHENSGFLIKVKNHQDRIIYCEMISPYYFLSTTRGATFRTFFGNERVIWKNTNVNWYPDSLMMIYNYLISVIPSSTKYLINPTNNTLNRLVS